jgi:glycine/D-amino acid oxidase-like deaminating enzyme
MRRDLDSLSQPFDLLVIGAGIHGACIARTAAMAGLRVALIEKGDFSVATSRNSAKLIHGGLRYIQHFDVPRIRESMVAQRTWFRFAPHLMRPLRFIIPTYGYATRGPVALAGGIVAFHMIAAGRNKGIRPEIRLPRSGVMSHSTLASTHPALDRDDVTGGAYWYDGQMLDAARVTLECVWDAVDAGAVAANHVEAVALLHDSSGVKGVVARDVITGAEFEVRASLTVNATGPWVDRVLATGPAALKSAAHHGLDAEHQSRHEAAVSGQRGPGHRQQPRLRRGRRQGQAAVFHQPLARLHGGRHDPRSLRGRPQHAAGTTGGRRRLPGRGQCGRARVRTRAGRRQVDPSRADAGRGGRVGARQALPRARPRAAAWRPRPHQRGRDQVHHRPRGGCAGGGAGRRETGADAGNPAVRGAVRRRARRGCFAAPPDEGSEASDSDSNEYAWAVAIYGARAEQCLGQPSAANRDAEQVFRNRVRFGVAHEMVVRLSDAVLRATDWAERGKLSSAQLEWCAATLAADLGWSPERRERELEAARAMLDQLHVTMRDHRPLDSAA